MADEELDQPIRKKKRPDRPRHDDEEERRPDPARARLALPGRRWPVLWVLAAVLLLAGVGGGIALWRALSKEGERVGETAPPRELPRTYFAYMPSEKGSVSVVDYPVRLTEDGAAALKPVPVLGVERLQTSDLEAKATSDSLERTADSTRVECYFLKTPVDLADWGKDRTDWEAKPVGGKTTYTQKQKVSASPVVFQPNPTTIVVVTNFLHHDWALVEKLARRTDGDVLLSAEQWDVLRQVSGYSGMSVSQPVKVGDVFEGVTPQYYANGSRRTVKGKEDYKVSVYASDDIARQALAEHGIIEKKLKELYKENIAKQAAEQKPDDRYA